MDEGIGPLKLLFSKCLFQKKKISIIRTRILTYFKSNFNLVRDGNLRYFTKSTDLLNFQWKKEEVQAIGYNSNL